MAHTDKQKTSPLREAAGNQIAARDRRAVRTEDLSEEEIAAVEASEMGPGFEHLDAELDPAGASVVEVGVDFGRKLRAHGDATKGRPADKAFRDSLFDDS
ncbi:MULTISPECIES: prevent-host-death protein [unclassified Bradyrhizobium]|uniref:prevent-host-death protein n=1 Tax=unclassified Bradyrhizobium TaxID=2631580 RepID=UPI001FFBCB56|nr:MULTISPECIES: prevent-host-death protein [unclassified Bradyrhizobium]MCK1711700.1 prevent-host-death protein [Bradyrhizobium sp. 143]MCK1725973.1 prevent-host-death protein [Bradyrhizobium sp. 142]